MCFNLFISTLVPWFPGPGSLDLVPWSLVAAAELPQGRYPPYRGERITYFQFNLNTNYIHEIISLYVICNKIKDDTVDSKCFWYFMYVIRKITKFQKRYGLNKSVCNPRELNTSEIL